MESAEAELPALVPEQCPTIEAACPKCALYLRTVGENWKWSIRKPNQVECPLCLNVYPRTAYPMDQQAKYLNFRGEEVTVSYHLGPTPKGDYRGNPHLQWYFFEGAIDARKYDWLTGRAIPALTEAYRNTQDERLARRIALVLDRLAERYPHYLLHCGRGINNYYISTGGPCLVDGKRKGTPGRDLPYGWTDGRIGRV